MSIDKNIDEELIISMKKDDIRAFDAIYNRYSSRLYNFVLGIIKSKKETEDIIQDVFLKIWESRDKIDEHQSFKSFLFTMSHNATISVLRKKMKNTKYVQHIKSLQFTGELSNTVGDIEFKELQKRLNNVINNLPERQQQVYRLSRENELSYKEIAEKMGISVNTVENHMVKALKFIRENMTDTRYVALIFCALFAC